MSGAQLFLAHFGPQIHYSTPLLELLELLQLLNAPARAARFAANCSRSASPLLALLSALRSYPLTNSFHSLSRMAKPRPVRGFVYHEFFMRIFGFCGSLAIETCPLREPLTLTDLPSHRTIQFSSFGLGVCPNTNPPELCFWRKLHNDLSEHGEMKETSKETGLVCNLYIMK